MTFFEWFYKALIVEGICVLILLLSVIFVKFFATENYQNLKKFYNENLTSDTSISEVLDSEI